MLFDTPSISNSVSVILGADNKPACLATDSRLDGVESEIVLFGARHVRSRKNARAKLAPYTKKETGGPEIIRQSDFVPRIHLSKPLAKQGILYFKNIPPQYLILFFADPKQIIHDGVSPKEYDARETGCTKAWCKGMEYILELLSDAGDSNPVVHWGMYLKLNQILTSNVLKTLSDHKPGSLRSVFSEFKSEHHTSEGISRALQYKNDLEEKNSYMSGSSDYELTYQCGFEIETKNTEAKYIKKRMDEHQVRCLSDSTSCQLTFTAVSPKIPEFLECCNPDTVKLDEFNEYEKKEFKKQLKKVSEGLINKLNNSLAKLLVESHNRSDQLNGLIDSLSEFLPKISQVHPFMDGNGRTNNLLIHYLFARFGFPPPLLMNPNHIDLIDENQCRQVLKAGLNNYRRLFQGSDDWKNLEEICGPIQQGASRSFSEYCKSHRSASKSRKKDPFNLPATSNFPPGYDEQARVLMTSELLEKLKKEPDLPGTGSHRDYV
ncbi:Fic family protein [Endozoicomonas elysicola]|nr:Fic family protein [Endozoicomonas elysicola]